MKQLIILCLITVFCTGCEGDEDRNVNCATVLCAADQFFISYQDTDGNPLIGTVFVQDSFKLSGPATTLYIKPVTFSDETDKLALFYGDLESDTTYTLELSPTESDSLIFSFTTNDAPCCISSTMSDLNYNSNTIAAESNNSYVLIR